ncbi:SCP2 sterol-binding domain-containing protein [Catellatospora tritici]|uniref:SCP2 sterol-binding domain-containing protein n=1 Tax=Catellatospora tritici TaxID=2851566 RepID=UPI001C2D7B7A|nr:SCP2 sterol-binding domain-containing protein [Catellatospora tritici]MBV1850902.1 SCP2 sterol-binding domain-containing protein [Catellatospora tritici]MBV1851155.1 SCP2 sterol-binding domain-containing protein [Catellatospora tritici]
MATTTATEEFFAALNRRGHEPLLRRTEGTIRFDIGPVGKPQQRWLVTLNRGDISVSRRGGKADCIVQADAAAFDKIVTGKDNGYAAYLRGLVIATGRLELLQLFQRMFAGPPEAARRRGEEG